MCHIYCSGTEKKIMFSTKICNFLNQKTQFLYVFWKLLFFSRFLLQIWSNLVMRTFQIHNRPPSKENVWIVQIQILPRHLANYQVNVKMFALSGWFSFCVRLWAKTNKRKTRSWVKLSFFCNQDCSQSLESLAKISTKRKTVVTFSNIEHEREKILLSKKSSNLKIKKQNETSTSPCVRQLSSCH